MNNTYETISNMIKRVNALGISVLEESERAPMKTLSITIVEKKGIKEMIPFKYIDGDDIREARSPFTWRLSREEFIEWATTATSRPFATIYKVVAKIIREMDIEDFNRLRIRSNLWEEMKKYFYEELSYTGFRKVSLTSAPALTHLTLIYGGLLNRNQGLENFVSNLFDMVLSGQVKHDRCRSCMWCKNKNDGGHICKNPLKEGFVIPSDMKVGEVINNFPDLKIQKFGDYKEYVTSWVPTEQPSCEYYNRRW